MKVLYAGSFDPITKGHMGIINEAKEMFDEVVVAVLINNMKKNYLFSIKERVELIKKIYKNEEKVRVVESDLCAVDVAKYYKCGALVRGIRGAQDIDYELTLAKVNNEISDNNLKTICLFGDFDYQHVSSTIVREVYKLGKSVSNYVDPVVDQALKLRRDTNGD